MTPNPAQEIPAFRKAYHAPIYRTGRASWQYMQPFDWAENRAVIAWHLGPCPRCGSITRTYGGGYSCCNTDCRNSASRFVTCTEDPTPQWWGSDVHVFLDGNAWCAVDGVTFTNLQESPAGFGGTPDEAVKALEKAWQLDAKKTFSEGRTPEKLALPTLHDRPANADVRLTELKASATILIRSNQSLRDILRDVMRSNGIYDTAMASTPAGATFDEFARVGSRIRSAIEGSPVERPEPVGDKYLRSPDSHLANDILTMLTDEGHCRPEAWPVLIEPIAAIIRKHQDQPGTTAMQAHNEIRAKVLLVSDEKKAEYLAHALAKQDQPGAAQELPTELVEKCANCGTQETVFFDKQGEPVFSECPKCHGRQSPQPAAREWEIAVHPGLTKGRAVEVVVTTNEQRDQAIKEGWEFIRVREVTAEPVDKAPPEGIPLPPEGKEVEGE